MTNKERTMAVLHDQPYDRMPVVYFGYWKSLLHKWHAEGHITKGEAETGFRDGSAADRSIGKKLGFDFNWQPYYCPNETLFPPFPITVLEELPGGAQKVQNQNGIVVLRKANVADAIPMEFDHLLKDRVSWETHYLPRLSYCAERLRPELLKEAAEVSARDGAPLALHCGSLYGELRNWMGFEGLCYLSADDEDLYDEIINTIGQLSYDVVSHALESGYTFDYAHFWEDICFKNGPMISPAMFREKVAPWYQKICGLLNRSGIDIISVDCDGVVDSLLPIWLESGVNTMFPVEVGTWKASIAPWRERYGSALKAVGGMEKSVLSGDYSDVDREIERLRPLIDLGGYIPCPDHRLPLDTKWETVQYYCDRMKALTR